MANLFRNFVNQPEGKVAVLPVAKTATLDATIVVTSDTFVKNLQHVTLDETIIVTLVGVADVIPLKATVDATIAVSLAAAGDVVRIGTLDKSFFVTLAGAANYGQNALLNKPITISLAAVGKVENKGQASNTLSTNHPLILTGVANVQPVKGTLVQAIVVTLTGQAENRSGKLSATIPITLTSTTTQQSVMHVAATMPSMTIVSVEENTPPNFNTFPLFTLDGTILNGSVSSVINTLPMFTIEIDLGHDTNVTLPLFTSNALLIPGNNSTVISPLPPLTIAAQLDSQVVLNAASTLPLFDLTAELNMSGAINVTGSLPLFTIDSLVFNGSAISAVLTLPVLTGTGFLAENGIGVLTATLPSLYSNGLLDNGAVAVFNPFAMNTENYSVTKYTNYNFHTVFQKAGKHYGVNTAGIFELVGTKDITTDIAASFKFGFSDMKKSGLKRVPYVYMGYTSDGNMKVDVSIDGEPVVRQYTIGNISNTSGIKRGRAKIARGLKSRYWQFGASNVAGADFEIDKLGFYIQQFDRKAQ